MTDAHVLRILADDDFWTDEDFPAIRAALRSAADDLNTFRSHALQMDGKYRLAADENDRLREALRHVMSVANDDRARLHPNCPDCEAARALLAVPEPERVDRREDAGESAEPCARCNGEGAVLGDRDGNAQRIEPCPVCAVPTEGEA